VKQEEICAWEISNLATIRAKLLNDLLIHIPGSLSQLFVIVAHIFFSYQSSVVYGTSRPIVSVSV
jgi:hypothetical protein